MVKKVKGYWLTPEGVNDLEEIINCLRRIYAEGFTGGQDEEIVDDCVEELVEAVPQIINELKRLNFFAPRRLKYIEKADPDVEKEIKGIADKILEDD